MTHNLKKIALLGTVLIAPAFAFAQEVAAATPAPEPPVMSLHLILGLIAVFMLFPVIVTGRTFLLAVNVYVQKVKKESDALKKAGVVALLMLSSQFADASSLGINAGPEPTDWLACILTGVIVFEFILFFYFSTQIKNFLSLQVKPEAIEETALTEPSKDWLEEVWDKLNSFKPLSEEANIDTGHSYDGIRELDNVTPPWFLAGFALSIVFAVVYLFQRHVSHTMPSQVEEYATAMAEADSAKAHYLATQGEKVDESNIKLMGSSDIEAGKAVFSQNCIACHAPSGGSMPGGVGPNLTDDYWIHGGTIQDIFKTIKYGYPEKGMISWKDQLSPKQIAQLSSFIITLNGTNPANAKEPQGELFKAEVAGTDSVALAPKDSALVVK